MSQCGLKQPDVPRDLISLFGLTQWRKDSEPDASMFAQLTRFLRSHRRWAPSFTIGRASSHHGAARPSASDLKALSHMAPSRIQTNRGQACETEGMSKSGAPTDSVVRVAHFKRLLHHPDRSSLVVFPALARSSFSSLFLFVWLSERFGNSVIFAMIVGYLGFPIFDFSGRSSQADDEQRSPLSAASPR